MTCDQIVATLSINLVLQLLVFDLQSLNNLLAEVGSLGELLLDLFVNSDISVECINLLLHLVIFGQKLLGLFRLILQLISQLVILQDRKSRRRVLLVVVQG